MQLRSYRLFGQQANSALIKQVAAAITKGDEKEALKLLSQPININEKFIDEKGNCASLLGLTAIVPNKKIIEKLLQLGANPNEPNDDTLAENYTYPVKLLVWQIAAFAGQKEAVEYFFETCPQLELTTPDGYSIVDLLKPRNSEAIQEIYKVTLKEMNEKQKAAYGGANAEEMEKSVISLIRAYQHKLEAISTKEKKDAKKEIRKILKTASDGTKDQLYLFDKLCHMLKDTNVLDTLAKGFVASNSVRNLLSGNSAIHEEIADMIVEKLENKRTAKKQ